MALGLDLGGLSVMIDVKQAADIASQYLISLFPNKAFSIQLEEVELSEDGKYWYITLSFKERPVSGFKNYKLFKINAETGQVHSMKIRKVA